MNYYQKQSKSLEDPHNGDRYKKIIEDAATKCPSLLNSFVLNMINIKLNYPENHRKYVDISMKDYINLYASDDGCNVIKTLVQKNETFERDITRRIKFDDMYYYF